MLRIRELSGAIIASTHQHDADYEFVFIRARDLPSHIRNEIRKVPTYKKAPADGDTQGMMEMPFASPYEYYGERFYLRHPGFEIERVSGINYFVQNGVRNLNVGKSVVPAGLDEFLLRENAFVAGSYATMIAMESMGLEADFEPNDIDVFWWPRDGTNAYDLVPFEITDTQYMHNYAFSVGHEETQAHCRAIIKCSRIQFIVMEDIGDHVSRAQRIEDIRASFDFTAAGQVIYGCAKTNQLWLSVSHLDHLRKRELHSNPDTTTTEARIDKWVAHGFSPVAVEGIEENKPSKVPKNILIGLTGGTYEISRSTKIIDCHNIEIQIIGYQKITVEASDVTIVSGIGRVLSIRSKITSVTPDLVSADVIDDQTDLSPWVRQSYQKSILRGFGNYTIKGVPSTYTLNHPIARDLYRACIGTPLESYFVWLPEYGGTFDFTEFDIDAAIELVKLHKDKPAFLRSIIRHDWPVRPDAVDADPKMPLFENAKLIITGRAFHNQYL